MPCLQPPNLFGGNVQSNPADFARVVLFVDSNVFSSFPGKISTGEVSIASEDSQTHICTYDWL